MNLAWTRKDSAQTAASILASIHWFNRVRRGKRRSEKERRERTGRDERMRERHTYSHAFPHSVCVHSYPSLCVQLSGWVWCEILRANDVKARVSLITKFISLAKVRSVRPSAFVCVYACACARLRVMRAWCVRGAFCAWYLYLYTCIGWCVYVCALCVCSSLSSQCTLWISNRFGSNVHRLFVHHNFYVASVFVTFVYTLSHTAPLNTYELYQMINNHTPYATFAQHTHYILHNTHTSNRPWKKWTISTLRWLSSQVSLTSLSIDSSKLGR